MTNRRRLASALVLAWLSVPWRAWAQDEGEPGFYAANGVEVVDLTYTMRDDDLIAAAVDPHESRIAYLASADGRVYRTKDAGQSWFESTVIAERRTTWQTGSSIFFGKIRDDNAVFGSTLEISPWLGGLLKPNSVDFRSTIRDRRIEVDDVHLEGYSTRYYNLRPGIPAPTLHPEEGNNPLWGPAYDSTGSSGAMFGVALSSRAPRLSLLVLQKGKSTSVLNRQWLLDRRGNRDQAVIAVAAHPTDPRLVFAGTGDGLFRSSDAGMSWVRVYMGSKPAESKAIHIMTDPRDDRRIYVGTCAGLLVSEDYGLTFSRITTVPELCVNRVVFDPNDERYIYLATSYGVWRSDDGGRNYQLIYFSTLPAENDVREMILDPFDASTAFIGTPQGVFRTTTLRTAKQKDWRPLASLYRGVLVQRMGACTKHRGHFYALTKGDLPSINYGADPPESLIFETWDGGASWAPILSGRTRGDVRWFVVDPADPDRLWVVWSKGLFRLQRKTEGEEDERARIRFDDPALGPTPAEVIQATLRYNDVEMRSYTSRIAWAEKSHWVPRLFTLAAYWRNYSEGAVDREVQYIDDRFRAIDQGPAWEVWAWATWSLPEVEYSFLSVPMHGDRKLVLANMLRGRMTDEITYFYGELRRLRAIMKYAPPEELETRAAYTVRMEQLEAIVDLHSGGYLTRWTKQHGSPDR